MGAVYRTGSRFNMNGDTHVRNRFYGPDGQIIMDREEKSDHYHEFIFPPSWGVGIAFKPIPRLTVTTDWQRTDWTKYRWPLGDIHYKDQGDMLVNTAIDPDWYATDSYRFGFEYKYSERLSLRGGYTTEDGGLPDGAEGITLMSLGKTCQYANAGFGYQWDVWNMDLMLGTMWGRDCCDVKHH